MAGRALPPRQGCRHRRWMRTGQGRTSMREFFNTTASLCAAAAARNSANATRRKWDLLMVQVSRFVSLQMSR